MSKEFQGPEDEPNKEDNDQEERVIKKGKTVIVAYKVRPKYEQMRVLERPKRCLYEVQ